VQSSTSGELKELPGLTRTPPIAAIEKSIHKALEIYKPETYVDLLVRHLAQSRLETVFERVYGAIYGSQIAGLRELIKRGGKISMADAVKGFDEAKSRSAFPANFTFDLWLQFLKAFDFIEAEDNEIRITDIGKDFLLYLSARGLPENKPY
jgi:hypothetical protein